MSKDYDEYLKEHIENVKKGCKWLLENIPEIFPETYKQYPEVIEGHFDMHDKSKFSVEEYEPYDDYFYREKTLAIEKAFNFAWLHHCHENCHHWQYWVIIGDTPMDGVRGLDMPVICIIEMICDWWSFSWKSGNLMEIFDWYQSYKNWMILSGATRIQVENILDKMYIALKRNEAKEK